MSASVFHFHITWLQSQKVTKTPLFLQ